MAYYFASLQDLADAYRYNRDQAAQDAERIRRIVRDYETRGDRSPSRRAQIERDIRVMGGISYLREVVRGHNQTRIAWDQALRMLEAVAPQHNGQCPNNPMNDAPFIGNCSCS